MYVRLSISTHAFALNFVVSLMEHDGFTSLAKRPFLPSFLGIIANLTH